MVIGIIGVVFVAIIIYFIVPYSPTKSEFNQLLLTHTDGTTRSDEVFPLDDIQDLPEPVQRYFIFCGFIGFPKMSKMKASYMDVDFSLGRNKPTIKIDYTQVNFVKTPDRIAYIDSSLYGIPFQGLDTYVEGNGRMKGVIAKAFTLFNQIGVALDISSLVTALSECLLIPSVALQPYITWESVDDTHAKATITFGGQSCSGIFTFNDEGEMLSFLTEDRVLVETDGTKQNVPWSAVCSEYIETNGIKHPTKLQAIWHYPDGDFIYFDGNNIQIQYD